MHSSTVCGYNHDVQQTFPRFRAYRHMVPHFTIEILNLAPVRCERGGDTYIQYVILPSSLESLE